MTACWSMSHSCVRSASTCLFHGPFFAPAIMIHPFGSALATFVFSLVFIYLLFIAIVVSSWCFKSRRSSVTAGIGLSWISPHVARLPLSSTFKHLLGRVAEMRSNASTTGIQWSIALEILDSRHGNLGGLSLQRQGQPFFRSLQKDRILIFCGV